MASKVELCKSGFAKGSHSILVIGQGFLLFYSEEALREVDLLAEDFLKECLTALHRKLVDLSSFPSSEDDRGSVKDYAETGFACEC